MPKLCGECGSEIIYSDRWFKKCKNGHTSKLSIREQWEYKEKHGDEK